MVKGFLADASMREVISKAATSFILRIAGAAAQLGFTLLLARLYGAEGMGAYTLALSVTVIATALSRWGVDQAALKNISIYIEAGRWKEVKAVFASSFSVIFLFGVVITALLYQLTPWIAGTFFSNRHLTELMQVMVLSIVPFALLNLAAECFRAAKRVAVNTLIQVVAVPVLMLVGIAVPYFGGSSQVIDVGYIYLMVCYATALGALIYWLLRIAEEEGSLLPDVETIHTLLQTAGPMAWATIIGIAMSFSETLLLGLFRPVDEVGIYSAALRVALLVNFVLVAFNTILAPKVASLFHHDHRDEIERLASRSVMAMLVLTAPLFILCFLFPEQLMLLFGVEFVGAATALMILAIGQLLNVLTGPIGVILLMTGQEKSMRRNSFVSAAAGVVAGVTFIPLFGVTGAALSSLFGGVMLQGLCAWSVKRELGINPFAGLRW